jgi:hypothetical protein
MLLRMIFLASLISLCWALPAAAQCSPEFSGDQCLQLEDNQDPTGGTGGGSGCRYYMCGNATGNAQANYVWCPESASYQNCPIAYCSYSSCIGTNCTPETTSCLACSSATGNNVHISSCPWQ